MDLVTLGEALVLLTPDPKDSMLYAYEFTRNIEGAESNVAIGVSRLGHQVGWISRVGNDEFGRALISYIRGEGVDISQVKIDSHAPTGLVFRESRRQGPKKEYGYNKHSAASKLSKEDLNNKYLTNAKYLYLTGIAPSLNTECYKTVNQTIDFANENQVKVIFDPNFRRKSWTINQKDELLGLLNQSQIIILDLEEAAFLYETTSVDHLKKHIKEDQTILLKTNQGIHSITRKDYQFIGFETKQTSNEAQDGFVIGLVSGLIKGLNITESITRGLIVSKFMIEGNKGSEEFPFQNELDGFNLEP